MHYNWHRHYDPTIGRYTQPDPLGFVDGPSVYGYARGRPQSSIDPEGESIADCAFLRAATVYFCKWKNERCSGNDDCNELAKKIETKAKCIVAQQKLSALCFPDDTTHEQRISDEEQGIKRCLKLGNLRGCTVCVAPGPLRPPTPVLPNPSSLVPKP